MNCSILRRFAALGALLLAGALGCQTLFAGNVYAGSCGTPNYPTIQMAVNAAGGGGNVMICPGTYPEQVTITTNVNLTGVVSGTSAEVVITSPAGGVVVNASDTFGSGFPVAAQILVENNANVMIDNITVDGSNNQLSGCGVDLRGIYYQNASGQINQVLTRNQTLASPGLIGCQDGQGIFVQSGYSSGQANVQIQNSTIQTFQKNGITFDGPGVQGHVQNNYIMGQGPTTGAAENGIQISDGAQVNVQNNVVTNEIYAPDTSSDTGDAAAGILVYAAQNIQIQSNVVSTTQFGIVTFSDPTSGTTHNPNGVADQAQIGNNSVLNTQIFDAIDVCSNNNQIQNNALSNSTEAGIHLDSSCGSTGNNNHVNGNLITEACAGVLNGGTSNNIDNNNNYVGVLHTILSGNVCPVVDAAAPAGGGTGAALVVRRTAAPKGRPTPVR